MLKHEIRRAFDDIHAEDALKEQTRACLTNAIRRAPQRKPIRAGKLAILLACFALVVFGGFRFYFTPVSAISIDINPSFELGVNRFDRVVSVRAFDLDGTALADGAGLKLRSYTDALDALFSSEAMRPYLANDALVSIAVVGTNDDRSEAMLARIESCAFAQDSNVECRRGNRAEVEAAHALGLSFGKYRAFLELSALDPEITADAIRGLSMRQIRDRIAALSGDTSAAPRGGMGAGKGNGARRRGGVNARS